MDNSFEEPKVPTKDLVDIKFAVIEFLYEFLKEDIDRIRDTKSNPPLTRVPGQTRPRRKERRHAEELRKEAAARAGDGC